jgi:uncharacterized protein (DUF2267 family)
MDYRTDYERFVTLVEQNLGVGHERAERAVRATQQTLAERIASGERGTLAEELSDELAPWVVTTTDAEHFDVDEFVRRVADREGVDVPTAERHARAVFAVLGRRSAGASSTTWPRSCRRTTVLCCQPRGAARAAAARQRTQRRQGNQDVAGRVRHAGGRAHGPLPRAGP